jgi:hypothetical protein
MADQPNDDNILDPTQWVIWVCPRCGKGAPPHEDRGPIFARAKTVIRCVCGHQSWSS